MKTLSLIFWVCVVASVYAAETNRQNSVTPLWSEEVVQDLSGARNLATPYLMDPNRAGIAFLDNERLLVYEVNLDSNHLSSRQSPNNSSSFRLHASVLEAGSGRVEFSKEWGTRSHESSVQVTSGRILVRTGDLLRLYSKDFAEFQQMPLSHPDPYEGWEISTSSSGKTVVLNHYIRNHKRRLDFSHFAVLDGSTFKLKFTWAETPALNRDSYSISDTAMARNQYKDGAYYAIATEFGSRIWNPIWKESERFCPAPPTFVTDSSFIYRCGGLSLVSTKGEVLMTDGFNKGESLGGKIAVAQSGRAVAVSLDRTKGIDFWDTGKGIRLVATHLLVYDVSLRKRFLIIEISPLPKNDYDFALSPDGSKLAVLNDRNVSVYSVPTE